MPIESKSSSGDRAIRWIALALIVWAGYLAVGATGIFVQRFGHAPLDERENQDTPIMVPSPVESKAILRAVLVIACVSFFLGLWLIPLGYRRRAVARSGSTSKASRLSLLSAAVGWLTYGCTWLAPASGRAGIIRHGAAAAAFLTAAICALVGLSDPRARSGKWAGLLALTLVAAATVVVLL